MVVLSFLDVAGHVDFDIPPRLKIHGFRCFQDAFDLGDIALNSKISRISFDCRDVAA